jgi:hypothetical protein
LIYSVVVPSTWSRTSNVVFSHHTTFTSSQGTQNLGSKPRSQLPTYPNFDDTRSTCACSTSTSATHEEQVAPRASRNRRHVSTDKIPVLSLFFQFFFIYTFYFLGQPPTQMNRKQPDIPELSTAHFRIRRFNFVIYGLASPSHHTR